jgi:hypothetical protein
MKDFTLKVTVPSGKEVRIKELTNRYYLQIIKFAENQDMEGLNLFFEEELFIDNDLDIIDRFYLVIFYRMMFVSGSITFTTKEKRSVDLDIKSILEKIENMYEDFLATVEDGDFKIKVGLPNTLFFKTADDIFNRVIREIHYKNNVIIFSQASQQDQETILSLLPPTIFFKLKEYINRISQTLQDFVVIEKNEAFDIEQHNINIISNGVMVFVCSLFAGSLASFYSMLYNFFSYVKGDSRLFFDISPIETRVLFNLYNKDIQEQNKQQQQQQRQQR